jgi:SAM-dependent methyltransferase
MILDAGCGNRCMWLPGNKNNENIIYSDIEKQLHQKPNLYASNTDLPFKTESFDTVFFDPPFKWNCDDHPFFSYPNLELRHKDYPNYNRNYVPSYYGIERYKSRSELVGYLYRAEKELYRILKPDGCLWMRWCNMTSMDHHNVLNIFVNWNQMLIHEMGSARRNTGETNSYWFMLMKKPLMFQQPELLMVVTNHSKE